MDVRRLSGESNAAQARRINNATNTQDQSSGKMVLSFQYSG